MANGVPPRLVISSATAASAASLRPTAATFAPDSANRNVVARPMPDVAPVTSTTFPENSLSIFRLYFVFELPQPGSFLAAIIH